MVGLRNALPTPEGCHVLARQSEPLAPQTARRKPAMPVGLDTGRVISLDLVDELELDRGCRAQLSNSAVDQVGMSNLVLASMAASEVDEPYDGGPTSAVEPALSSLPRSARYASRIPSTSS